jgi:hypothetical protein
MNIRINGRKDDNRTTGTISIWNTGCSCFDFLAGPFKIAIRFAHIGFNVHDLFFISYFRLRDRHYKKDIIPTFRHWCRVSTGLSPHVQAGQRPFDNMFLNVIQGMQQIDNKSMARCHLQAYHYSDYRSFESLTKEIRRYNDMVQIFINHIAERIEIFLKIELPYLREYKRSEDTQSNYYHYDNILYYFWLVYWDSRDGRIEIKPEIVRYGNTYHLRITGEPIASSDNEKDVTKLQTFLNESTSDVVDWITRLNDYRNEEIGYYNVFRQNIALILDGLSWNKSLKGKCGWERGFWNLH